MGTFNTGSFTTSTPFHQQNDSGICENSPTSRDLSQTSAGENLEFNYLPLRKNLFGRKRNISENIPDDLFSHRHKLILSRSKAFSRRDASSNKETPRTRNSRSCAGLDKPVYFTGAATPKQPPQLFSNKNTAPWKQLDANDSGFCSETPESEYTGIPLLQLIENFHPGKENSKEKSLAYFKHSLNVSGAKNYADLSTAEIQQLYSIYRYQRMGVKPSVSDMDFIEKHPLINDESEMFLLSWKDTLEHISADLEKRPRIDFLSHLHKMNAHSIVSNILSYLSGCDLQNISHVSRMWRKLVLDDDNAKRKRLAYLKERQNIKKAMEKKSLVNPFQRPSNFRILESIENVQREKLHFAKTIKEINFDAFIEVGKSAKKHKPMKCPSCGLLSLQDKQVITKCNCLFCGFEFCRHCLDPYSNWHFCGSKYHPPNLSFPKPASNSKKYLRRL